MKDKNRQFTIIVIILCVLLCGESSYIVYDKLLAKRNNNTNNNAIPEEKADSITISEEQVKKIYSEDIKKYIINSDRQLSFNSLTFKNEYEKLEWVRWTKEKELERVSNFCGTETETVLVNEKIISKQGEGQLDCNSTSLIKGQSVINAVKKTFGENVEINLNNLGVNSFNNQKMYIEKLDLLFADGFDMIIPVTEQYIDYSIDSNILKIRFSITDNDEKTSNYEAKYIIKDGNTYIKSINKM